MPSVSTQSDESQNMTLLELAQLLRKHLRFVILVPIVCALAVGIYSVIFMSDEYTATTSMYVLVQQGDNSQNSSLYNDLSASQMVTNDVAKLLKSDRIINQTGEQVGVEALRGYDTDISSETNSRVITLSVTGEDPTLTARIANAMVSNVSDVARDVMSVESVDVIDQAVVPDRPSGPNRPLYVAVAFLAGLFIAIVIVVVADMLNTRIRGQEDLEDCTGLPVLGRIPAMRGVQ